MSISKILSLILVLAIGYLTLYIFVFLDRAEIFSKASEVGVLFYRLSIGYIAATMFYYIVNYFPQKIKRAKMLANLETQVNSVELNINSILNEFNYPNGLQKMTLENYSKEGINSILQNTALDFRTAVNYIGHETAGIIFHIEVQTESINRELQDIEKHIDLISPELFKSIKEVQRARTSNMFKATAQMLRHEGLPNPNFVLLTDIFTEYLNQLKEFKSEWAKNKS